MKIKFISISFLGIAIITGVYGYWLRMPIRASASISGDQNPTAESAVEPIKMPEIKTNSSFGSISRLAKLKTNIPDRPNTTITNYVVAAGDTAWSIAMKFDLEPETILWGNESLSAAAGNLKIGAELNILPVDGVLHVVKENDTFEKLEQLHGIPVQEILEYSGNNFDLTSPELELGQEVIIPNGRNPVAWDEPGPQVIAGLGRKSPGLYSGGLINWGTGYFVWPIAPPIILTTDFWSGHLGIDMDTYFRQPVFAADSGTVIFSGWDSTGYGNLVIIDHGNGYWTYYGHNEANLVSTGYGVVIGQQIAESGSTGNSTGDHLDFRIRVDGSVFVNPLDFLP